MGEDGLVTWSLRPARLADVEPIVELRAVAMRPDLERLGRYDEHRVRQRLRDAFVPGHTWVVMVDDALAGCVAVRPAEDGHWLEHFYLDVRIHGRGVGSAVLRTVLRRTDADGVPVRLNVLQGSPAQRLYARHGFTVEAQDPVDVLMVREPGAGVLRRGDAAPRAASSSERVADASTSASASASAVSRGAAS
ncbi:GNAT family N-acetyltransferase [Streptomyces sp. NBC_00083]|uniref:GNAT family N-acetyltransferase n=1 Tax=Streptomyces sp. NBC_00083 TaxID=2975647 RepID=UPI00225220DF|nr:GNAT family N-acetyltransferase [Streptomyces sp. NBC_00083]MCX5384136.1 GNAT family N-acetyltransferase [Streptomyces sp. NBC_00083]